MPTATTASTKAKPRAKAASRPASAKASAARSASNGTQAKAKDTTEVFGEYAERAVLIPVGAALIARDRVVSSVSDTISSYSSPSRAQAQMRRFERRGLTARKRLEREVRKARVRVERELRQRRRKIESTVSDLEERRDAFAKNGGDLANRVPDLANRVPELANRVQERILSLV
ncbi:MAG TPA: hypothetical protein VK272_07410 [Solirubrobacteraceae bacterium]|nr:hypothetical protein [Solirubrobacteraceae bacterium]